MRGRSPQAGGDDCPGHQAVPAWSLPPMQCPARVLALLWGLGSWSCGIYWKPGRSRCRGRAFGAEGGCEGCDGSVAAREKPPQRERSCSWPAGDSLREGSPGEVSDLLILTLRASIYTHCTRGAEEGCGRAGQTWTERAVLTSCDDVRGLAQRVSSGGDQGAIAVARLASAGRAPWDAERRAVRAADACIVLAKINVSVLGNLRRYSRIIAHHGSTQGE